METLPTIFGFESSDPTVEKVLNSVLGKSIDQFVAQINSARKIDRSQGFGSFMLKSFTGVAELRSMIIVIKSELVVLVANAKAYEFGNGDEKINFRSRLGQLVELSNDGGKDPSGMYKKIPKLIY